jgi:hypothetical protein
MTPTRATWLAVLTVGAVTAASAQTGPPSAPKSSPRPPGFAITPGPNEIYRGPPLPPDRPDPPPRPAISPPMERAPQLPPMSPRIGN